MQPTSQDILQIEKPNVNATVLFCDLAEFTKVSASIPIEQIVKQLDSYMKVVAITVEEYRGTVAKFIGDAIEAYWLEEEHPDHAKLACQFASTIRGRLSAASFSFETRIGIHSGHIALVRIKRGNYASLEPISDTVNTASRLVGLCGEFKTSCIISEQVIDRGGGGPSWTALGTVIIKGKTTPMTLYKLA